MKITISELRQIIIEEVEREAELEEVIQLEERDPATVVAHYINMYLKRKSTKDKMVALRKQFPGQEDGFFKRAIYAASVIGESLNEELTKTDKAEIKRMISKELDSSLQKELKKALEEELAKALKSKDIKTDIGEISKKVLKKLYKDLSLHHPYIIDRIKV